MVGRRVRVRLSPVKALLWGFQPDVVDWAQFELKSAPVVGRQIDFNVNVLQEIPPLFFITPKNIKKINSLNKKVASQLILNYLLCAYFVARHYSGVASQQFKESHNLYVKQLRWALLRGALNMPIIERNVGSDATANVHTLLLHIQISQMLSHGHII